MQSAYNQCVISRLLVHNKFIDVFREYLFVGGMPEAVKEYVETGALNTVRTIQKSILSGYDLDFSKHAPKELGLWSKTYY